MEGALLYRDVVLVKSPKSAASPSVEIVTKSIILFEGFLPANIPLVCDAQPASSVLASDKSPNSTEFHVAAIVT